MSYEKFVNQVQKTGGASMDLNSGKLLQPGKKGFMVGGEPDRHGAPIPAHAVPEDDFGEKHVSDFVNYMKNVSGSTFRVNVGAWKDNGEVVMDASKKAKRAKEAIRKGRNRDQKAIWDNKNMREIDTGGVDRSREH